MSYTGVWGDSIAVGLQRAYGLGGQAREGLGPSAIADMIERAISANPTAFRGAKPLVSTGLSNNPRDISGVERQIRLLKSAGANPSFVGLAQGRYDAQNNLLSQLTRNSGVGFLGGFRPGTDAVHPESYSNLYNLTAARSSSPSPATMNSFANYIPIRSGRTGPSRKIGGSTEYHIDLKINESLPIAESVKAFDAIARHYQSQGRDIEFSNNAVSGRRWNPDAELNEKISLLNQVAAAHSHNIHPGWRSLDFYVPLKGKNRFAAGAVEDAEIFLPAVPGGRVRRKSGGGYGYHSESLDPSGKVLFRVGHGDIDKPEAESELVVPGQGGLPAAAPEGSGEGSSDDLLSLLGIMQATRPQKTLKDVLLEGVLSEALTPEPSLSDQFLRAYMASPIPRAV